MEAQKLVPSSTKEPTANQTLIDTLFTVICSEWDKNLAQSKESILVYHQTLFPNLKETAWWFANLSKVYDVRQELDESQVAFLQVLHEAFRRCNSESQENTAVRY